MGTGKAAPAASLPYQQTGMHRAGTSLDAIQQELLDDRHRSRKPDLDLARRCESTLPYLHASTSLSDAGSLGSWDFSNRRANKARGGQFQLELERCHSSLDLTRSSNRLGGTRGSLELLPPRSPVTPQSPASVKPGRTLFGSTPQQQQPYRPQQQQQPPQSPAGVFTPFWQTKGPRSLPPSQSPAQPTRADSPGPTQARFGGLAVLGGEHAGSTGGFRSMSPALGAWLMAPPLCVCVSPPTPILFHPTCTVRSMSPPRPKPCHSPPSRVYLNPATPPLVGST